MKKKNKILIASDHAGFILKKKLVDFFKKNEVIQEADTWLGKDDKVDLVALNDISVSIPKAQLSSAKVSVIVEEPIATPIQKGDQIAKLQISFADKNTEFPLFSGEDVEQKNFFSRIFNISLEDLN